MNLKMARAFHPVLPFNLIQGIRLAHALMESRFDVCIPVRHSDKFSKLEEHFGAEFQKGVTGVESIDSFVVDHSSPKTSVGSIKKPLIFPHSIVNHCRTLWGKERNIKISFEGLITKRRKKLLTDYVKGNFKSGVKIYSQDPVIHRVKNKVRAILGMETKSYLMEVGDISILSSRKGREFPVKAWDEKYFDRLSRSKFVICPSGDYVWSYRFFESILCGAIPIIEEKCEAYNGFLFYNLTDDTSRLEWTEEKAKSNYERCTKRISVSTKKINSELEKMVK